MSFGSAEVFLLEEADEELKALPVGERVAMRTAFKKLEQAGSALTFPHQSSVKGVNGLRELRPRGGRSRYRSFYKRTGPNQFVVGAIGPEAQVDPRGFQRSVKAAQERLSKYEGLEDNG